MGSPGGIGPALLPDVEHGHSDELLGSHALRLAGDRGIARIADDQFERMRSEGT